MADIVQARLDDLEMLATRFTEQSDRMQALLTKIVAAKNDLQGEWVGRGANSFFDEMENDVLLGVQRLVHALAQAGTQTNQIHRILSEADEEAAGPFRIQGDSYGAGGGAGGYGANASPYGGSGGAGSIDSLIGGLEDSFDSIFPNGLDKWGGVTFPGQSGYPEQGVWSDGLSGINDGNGYGSITDPLNEWASSMGFGDPSDSSSWGSFPFGGNDNGYFVPQDWLDGVTGELGSGNNNWEIPENWLDGVLEGLGGEASGAQENSAGQGGVGGGAGGGGMNPSETTDSTEEEAETPMSSGGGGGGSSEPASISSPYGPGSDFGGSQGASGRGGVGEAAAAAPQFQAQSFAPFGGGGDSSSGGSVNTSVSGSVGAFSTGSVESAPTNMMGVLVGITAAASPMVALLGKMAQAKLFKSNS